MIQAAWRSTKWHANQFVRIFTSAVEKTIPLIESKNHSQQSRSKSGRMTKAIRLCFDFESKLIVSYHSKWMSSKLSFGLVFGVINNRRHSNFMIFISYLRVIKCFPKIGACNQLKFGRRRKRRNKNQWKNVHCINTLVLIRFILLSFS